ncbi:hypothetical protein Taro_003711, partial [Colocasia esculenta]|nr:hypothetical protein [Colocasia esculenta]
MAALGPVCCRGVDVQAETAKEGRSVGSWRRRQLLQLSNSWLLSSSSPPSSPSANCREKMTTLEEETMMAAEAGVLGQNKRSDLAGRDGQTKKAEEKLPNPPDACTHCCCCCRCGCILAFPATAHNPEPSASSRPAQTDGWGLPVVVAADVGSIPMGCVQGKSASSVFSPPLGLEKLKLDHGYVGGVKRQPGDGSAAGNGGAGEIRGRGNAGDDVVKEGDASIPLHPAPVHDVLPPAPLGLEGGKEEMVEGWPLWLLQNIPREALVKFVPRSADDYIMIEKVGQGTYSNVYKAWERETGKIVALKKVRFETSDSESVRFMAREIMVLQELDHPNIVKLEGLATSRMNRSLYLVFEFMYSDLARILSHRDVRLTEAQVKCYMQQLLSGLEHCHNKGILHRDIKGSNLLIDKDGRLKIADFGLANYFSPDQKYPLTSRVVTLWYRAPELILGATDYGVGIDLWSAGCLLAEMLAGRPILPGRTEVMIEQLHRIFKLCGSPSEDYFKRFKKPTTFRPPQPYIPSISETFKYFPPSSLGLLTSLLALEPSYRCSASAALQNE